MLIHEFLDKDGKHIPYLRTNWYAEKLDKFYGDDNNGHVHGIYHVDENGDIYEVSWFKNEKEREEELNELLKEV